MRSNLEQINVSNLINSAQSCDDKVSTLETIVKIGLDFIMPLETRTVISNASVWITSSLKDLIGKRQKALNSGSFQKFKRLRNCVNRERKNVVLNITKRRSIKDHQTGGEKSRN